MNVNHLNQSDGARMLMRSGHGFRLFPARSFRSRPERSLAKSSGEEGLAQGGASIAWRDIVPVPRNAREIVLACGYVAAAAFGLATLITIGDPIGWVYLALSAVGYFYVQTRGLPAFTWLLVAAGGYIVGVSGNPSGWVECGLGAALAVVALLPTPSSIGHAPDEQPVPIARPAPTRPAIELSGHVTAASSVEPSDQSTIASPKVGLRACGPLGFTVAGNHRVRLEPRLELLLSYLLARRVLGHASTDRQSLAEEVSPPAIAQGHKLDRLRKQLHELQAVDPAVSQVVRADRHKVWLELQDVDCDVTRLLDVAKSVAADKALIDTVTLAELTDVLAATAGEFLAGFDAIEHEILKGQTGAAGLVQSARLSIADARAVLVRALADHHIAAGRAEAAIPYLTTALEGSTDHQDLARLLVAAYLQTGQMSRARDARREYGLIEES
jgi:hypothetical protein